MLVSFYMVFIGFFGVGKIEVVWVLGDFYWVLGVLCVGYFVEV